MLGAGLGWAGLGGRLVGQKGKAKTGNGRMSGGGGKRMMESSGLLPVESQVTKGPEMSRRGRLRDGAGLDWGEGAKARVGSRGDNGSLKMGPLCWAVGLGSGWARWYGVAVRAPEMTARVASPPQKRLRNRRSWEPE